jgi:hypothetical protein
MTDWWTIIIAAYAAIVATGALALEIRRWFESGPRLSLHIMPKTEMINAPGTEGNTYLFATVTNRGSAPTTITHFELCDYGSWFGRLRSKPTWRSLVLHPHPSPHVSNLPAITQPGQIWQGMALYEHDLEKRIEGRWLYVMIHASHTDKPTSKRVRRPAKPPKDPEAA